MNQAEAMRCMYEAIQPFVLSAKKSISRRIQCLADVGCGNGAMTELILRDVVPNRAILVDIENRLVTPPVPPLEFRKLDVCSQELVTELEGTIQMVTCLFSFHEFADPLAAFRNIAATLPLNGGALIVDRSEERWRSVARGIRGKSHEAQRHYEEDLAMVTRTGLGTDRGIREFWEERARPVMDGGFLAYSTEGAFYTVFYHNR